MFERIYKWDLSLEHAQSLLRGKLFRFLLPNDMKIFSYHNIFIEDVLLLG